MNKFISVSIKVIIVITMLAVHGSYMHMLSDTINNSISTVIFIIVLLLIPTNKRGKRQKVNGVDELDSSKTYKIPR
jgi:hypothetical protein